MTKPTQGEINHYASRPLRTFQLKGITVGALICNDMWTNRWCLVFTIWNMSVLRDTYESTSGKTFTSH
ncbi:MAG: hypothetical protein HQ580_03945 [Planctomycetes bacterium]|nr:hypothetical protein [Planctomycetota bacterium]